MANPTTNIGMTKPTVGGSTDTWGTTINEEVVDVIDALFSISGTDVTMSDIKFNSMSVQETGAGTDTVKIQAPAAVTTSYTLTMPAAVGTDGQVLSAAGAAGVLAWTTPEVGDITSVADATNGGMTVTNGGGPAVTLAVNLNDLSAAAVNVATDSIAILDADDSSTKKESIADLATAMGGTGLTGASGTLAVDAAQTQITSVGTIGTGTWQGTAVANAYLANSSVNYGGVSVALGAEDLTPAFNLSDATAYTGDSSLVTVGTVASGTWNGSTVAVAYGGTGATTFTDGGVLLGSGTGAITATAVLGDGEILIGDASGDPTTLDVGSSTAITVLGTVVTGTWNATALATAYIADNAVTLAKLEDGTSGDILYYAASGVPTRLAKGSDTHVLTLSGGLPVWSASNVGDITNVIAGNGLTGGGDTGDVTLNVAGTTNRILVNANDVDIASTYVGQTSITTLGTIATGTWSATAVAGDKGGTGLTSYTAGDIIYATGSTTLAKLAKGSDTEVLTLASGVPTWAAPTVGDITGVTAGTGLSGGGTSGTVTLNVEASQTGITSVGALGAGSITSGFGAIDVGSSSIDGGTITGTFSGNITGNLTGNVTGNTSGTAATVTGAAQTAITSLGTITSLVATTADINAGTFDGIVGGTTPADGSFTTLSASAAVTLSTTLDVTGNVGLGANSGVGHALEVSEIVADTDVARFSYSADDGVASAKGFRLWNIDATSANDGGLTFSMSDNGGVERYAGAITVDKVGTWTSTASTRDSQMRFSTAIDGVIAERMRIKQDGTFLVTSATEMSSTLSVTGNVMVGNTVANPASGFAAQKGIGITTATGNLEASANNSVPLELGRYGGVGTIQAFRYAGTSIGYFAAGTTSTLDLALTGKLYLDGGSDSYIFEASANSIQIVVEDVAMFTVNGNGWELPATKKLYLDGGADTYIYEESADDLHFVTGGTARFTIAADGKANFNQGTSAAYPAAGLGSYWATAENFSTTIRHDGNATTSWGLAIICGTDGATGTNTAVSFLDGAGTTQGTITFTGGTVSYNAFTAGHDASCPNGEETGYAYGTLVEIVEIYYKQNEGQDSERGIIYKVQKSQSAYAKNVLGAYSGKYDTNGPQAGGDDNLHQIYVLGDGHIICNGENGDIELGDGICTSSTEGEGMKADQLSMIIGIAQEDTSFSGPSETKLVPVQYGLRQFQPWN